MIDFPCTGDAQFSLDWSSNALPDFYVWGTDGDEALASVLSEAVDPPAIDAVAGGRLYILVTRWDGESGSYDFTVDRTFGESGDDDDDDDASDDDDDDDDATTRRGRRRRIR